MVLGWRRAFCTSIPKERESTTIPSSSDKHQQQQHSSSSHSPRISSKYGFFSNPSTPRLQSQPVSSPSLRCRTTATPPPNAPSSVPNSPKLQCKTNKSISPRLFHFSSSTTVPSSPKSPSSFSFLKASLRLSKQSSRCSICLQSVKSGQGTAIFTAECNHVFHFPCVASHVKKNHLLICPVCNTAWKEPPLLSFHSNPEFDHKQQHTTTNKAKNLRVYNDDEPLTSPSPGSLFNPIPEEEYDEDDDVSMAEFQGFFVNPTPPPVKAVNNAKNVEVCLLPESAVVVAAAGRSYETHVVVMRVRAPPSAGARRARRAPIDLVTVLDVSERMCGARSQMMKRAMRLVISSLGSADRLSIVAFSATSKRLLPLRRMTASGRRSARRVVEALGSAGQGMSVNDALKKAAKVIEDRREKNPVASIMILSNGHEDRSHTIPANQKCFVTTTRFSHSDIPVHSVGLGGESSACFHAHKEDTLAKAIGGLLSVVVQDVKLQLGFVSGSASAEISTVYSLGGRPGVFGPGSIRLGDFHAEEERELLVELRVPAASSNVSQHLLMSVRSSFRDASSQERIFPAEVALLVPRAQAVRSSVPAIQRLRNLHVTTRAAAESRRLAERGDLSGAYHLLSSARALLMQSADGSAGEYLRGLEAELAELNLRRQQLTQSQRQRSGGGGGGQQVEEKPESLTPTSAWRAAERLAKVAIMRKHMNRVSDLHGFENARF